jgi:hypothetical protein
LKARRDEIIAKLQPRSDLPPYVMPAEEAAEISRILEANLGLPASSLTLYEPDGREAGQESRCWENGWNRG